MKNYLYFMDILSASYPTELLMLNPVIQSYINKYVKTKFVSRKLI